jgi:hypothetical protein
VEKAFANPNLTHYVAIFYDQKRDKVIGWGKFSTFVDPQSWEDVF